MSKNLLGYESGVVALRTLISLAYTWVIPMGMSVHVLSHFVISTPFTSQETEFETFKLTSLRPFRLQNRHGASGRDLTSPASLFRLAV